MKSHKHPSSMVLQFRYIYVRRKQIITKTIDSLHTIATFFEIFSMIEGRSSKQRAKGKKRSIRDKRNSRERTLSRLFDTHSLPLKHHSLSKRSISRCSSFFFFSSAKFQQTFVLESFPLKVEASSARNTIS